MPIMERYPDLAVCIRKNIRKDIYGLTYMDSMYPIVFALEEKAKDAGVDFSEIKSFRSKCDKEFHAIFYTNKKTIQKEIDKMVELIKEKE